MDSFSPTPLDFFCAARPERRIHVMLVAAHPDDEVIGAASRLMVLGPSITLVHLTDGSPRNLTDAHRNGCATSAEYALVRQREFAGALRAGNIEIRRHITLGVPDQESSYRLGEISRHLVTLLTHHAPQIVATHAYEGGHPDHDAAAFAVQTACERLRHERRSPVRIEFASYFAASSGLCTGDFLPGAGRQVRAVDLTSSERATKRRMLDAFVTQRETLRQFGTEFERFRLAPDYDFTRPPHNGSLHYERYNWGIDGDWWRAGAAVALREMAWHSPC